MTIEEKAKAYDEALERARRLNVDNMLSNEAIEEIFPEVAESNDERIRKGLQNFLWRIANGEMNDRGTMPSAKMCQEWIAYLEKQKESLPISETCKENANSFTDGIIEVRSFQRGMEEGRKLEKQKELENTSASTMAPSCWAEEPSLQKEQEPEPFSRPHENGKPAECSKEDTKMLEATIAFVKHSPFSRIGKGKGKNNVLSWLNSLPERFNLQPKEEWSDEDEDAINGAIGILLDDNNPNFVFPEHSKLSVGEIVKKLKSLRPSWKPSEEQMKALDKAIPVCMGVVGQDAVAPLESLYEDLKKL